MKNTYKIFIIASGLLVLACAPSHVQQSSDQIELAYIKAGIYKPVSCSNTKYQQHWYVRCGATGSKTGGIFQIRDQNIYAVNGTARRHAENSGLSIAGVATGIDISALHKAF